MTDAPRFCCSRCRAALATSSGERSCGQCGSDYPLRHGFPDFRTGAAVDVDPEEDLELAALLAAREADCTFSELRNYYYSLSPEASAELHARHEAHFRAEAIRAARIVSQLGAGPLLDLGCGAGQYLLAAARAGIEAVGVDASLCQLILARRLLADERFAVELALADAEALPFPGQVFHAVIAADIIEHVTAPEKLLAEAARVLVPGATLRLTTPNRYSLTPEPHVGLWGVGWLPHSLAATYVRARTNIDYRSVRLLSLAALRVLLERTFSSVDIRLPTIAVSETNAFPPLKRIVARTYHALCQLSSLRPALLRITPYFEATCRK